MFRAQRRDRPATWVHENRPKCQFHGKDVVYFCQECCVLLCSDCLYNIHIGINTNHKEHRIEKISDLPKQLLGLIASKEKEISQSIKLLKESLASYSTEDTRNEERCELSRIRLHLSKVLESEHATIEENICKNGEQLNIMAEEILSAIQNGEIVLGCDDVFRISQTIKDIRSLRLATKSLHLIPTSIDWPESVFAKPKSFTFSINGFDVSDPGRAYTTSEVIKLFSHEWRCKVYPNGFERAVGTHVSAFVELRTKIDYSFTCICLISVIHPHNQSLNFKRVTQTDFMNTSSWGWCKLISHKELVDGSFLHEDGSFVLEVQIRPLDFYGPAQISTMTLDNLRTQYKYLKKRK